MYSKYHKINPNHGGSYIGYSDWIIKKKTTINSINKKDNKCFQYTVTVSLNHEEIGKNSERLIKIKRFINKYVWEGLNVPSEKHYWTQFEKKNRTMFCVLEKKKQILSMF